MSRVFFFAIAQIDITILELLLQYLTEDPNYNPYRKKSDFAHEINSKKSNNSITISRQTAK
jgi:hypothetical protein